MIELPNSDKIALILQQQSISYQYLKQSVDDYQSLFQAHQQVYAITARASYSFVCMLLAGLKAKKTLIVLADKLSSEDQKKRLAGLGDYVYLDDRGESRLESGNGSCIPHPLTRIILFTTGSTGEVKGVQLSEENILANCNAIISSLEMSDIQSQLVFLPLHYSFGLCGQFLPGLMAGLSTRILEHFIEIKSCLEAGTVADMLSGVPSHWHALLQLFSLARDASSSIKKIVCAGAPMPIQLRNALITALPDATIYLNYGLTEASPRVLCLNSRSPAFLRGATGYPIGDWEIKVNQKKELLLKGKQVMLGYLGQVNNPICDGWLNTGDIAEVGDKNLVTIQARQQKIIKVGGEKVNLVELEATLAQACHLSEALIVAVDDNLYGHRLLAFLESRAAKETLLTKARQALYPKAYPIEFHVISALPRHESGKVDQRRLVESFA